MNLVEIFEHIPVIALLALCFYCLILACAAPPLRQAFMRRSMLPTPSNQMHLAPLDAFRGIAALSIALFHTCHFYNGYFTVTTPPAFLQHGDKAVPIFVVLSGFLIFRAAKKIADSDDFRRYLHNRFLRIFPVYTVCVVVMAVAGQMGLLTSERFLREFLQIGLMLHVFDAPYIAYPPTWSLYVEVLFYLVVPAFVVLTRRNALLCAAIAFALFAFSDLSGPRELMLWKYFFVGIIASEIHERLHLRIGNIPSLLIFFLGAALMVVDVHLYIDWFGLLMRYFTSWEYPHGGSVTYTVGLAIAFSLMLVGAVCSSVICRFFSAAPWRILASASYSIFLWHWAILSANIPIRFSSGGSLILENFSPGAFTITGWTMAAVYVPAFLFAGIVSYIFIERPFLVLRDREVRSPI